MNGVKTNGTISAARFVTPAIVVLALTVPLGMSARGALARPDGGIGVVRVPDGGIQPQLQTDGRGRVHMIYFKGDPKRGDVLYVRSDDAGATFTAPLRVNSQPESVIAIGTIRGPRMALGKGDRVHVAWMGSDTAQPKVGGKGVPMLYSRMNDAGEGFEPQRNVIRSHAGLDGGGAVAADAEGNVYVAWHAPDQGDSEADRQVWLARSSDEGKSFNPEEAVAPPGLGACGCCGMNIAAGPKGRVFVLFRSARETVNRDMYLLGSVDHGRTFKVLNDDAWSVGMCVMSTAHFAGAGDDVLAAWETQNQIRVLRLGPGGAKAGQVESVPGKGMDRKHPAIAANRRGEFIVAWTEDTGWNKGGRVAWQVFDRNGRPEPGKSGRAEGLPAWDVPAVFAAPDDSFKVAF